MVALPKQKTLVDLGCDVRVDAVQPFANRAARLAFRLAEQAGHLRGRKGIEINHASSPL
jgi:hypothetical protein